MGFQRFEQVRGAYNKPPDLNSIRIMQKGYFTISLHAIDAISEIKGARFYELFFDEKKA